MGSGLGKTGQSAYMKSFSKTIAKITIAFPRDLRMKRRVLRLKKRFNGELVSSTGNEPETEEMKVCFSRS